MCELCESLERKIKAATSDGDVTKARLMAVILRGHCHCQHGAGVEVVAITPDSIIWPGGKIWVVGREDALDKTR